MIRTGAGVEWTQRAVVVQWATTMPAASGVFSRTSLETWLCQSRRSRESVADEQAIDDDLLDAWLDEEGTDSTGL
jgi:hypothetical protein